MNRMGFWSQPPRLIANSKIAIFNAKLVILITYLSSQGLTQPASGAYLEKALIVHTLEMRLHSWNQQLRAGSKVACISGFGERGECAYR